MKKITLRCLEDYVLWVHDHEPSEGNSLEDEMDMQEDSPLYIWADTGDVFRFEFIESENKFVASHHVSSGKCIVELDIRPDTDVLLVEGPVTTLSYFSTWPVSANELREHCNFAMSEFSVDDYSVNEQREIVRVLTGVVFPPIEDT